MKGRARWAGPLRGPGAAVLVAVVVLATLRVGLPSASATSYPPLSEPGRAFLGNLSVPPVDPGGSGSVTFTVTNAANASWSSAVVTVGIYAFNGYPGNGATYLPVAHAPVLDNGSSTGPSVNVSVGPLPHAGAFAGRVAVRTSSATPTGTFAIRTALTFSVGPTIYRLESRGWFSPGLWANATRGPNGSATVNLTMLNVSGVLPETGLLVRPSSWPLVLGALFAAGLVLVGAGAFVYFRRTSSSSSGAG